MGSEVARDRRGKARASQLGGAGSRSHNPYRDMRWIPIWRPSRGHSTLSPADPLVTYLKTRPAHSARCCGFEGYVRIITPTFCRAVLPGPDGWGVPACGPGPGRRTGRGRPRCHGSTRWCAGGHVLRGARCGVLGAGRQLSAALSLRRPWSVARRQARVCARDAWAGGSYVSRGWLCVGGGLPSCSAGRRQEGRASCRERVSLWG